jgi:hypothetical protein
VEKWLNEHTHAQKEGARFNTARKNSTETAYNWEKLMNYRLVKDINVLCSDVIKYLNLET